MTSRTAAAEWVSILSTLCWTCSATRLPCRLALDKGSGCGAAPAVAAPGVPDPGAAVTTELVVFVAGQRAGVARRQAAPDDHLVMFRYDDAYIADPASSPLSLRLPVDAGEREISRWLEGLLPDNPGARTRWAAQQQAAAPDAMSLLSTPVGLDCAGAVQFCLPGDEDAITARNFDIDWHTDEQIASWIREAKQGRRAHLGSQIRHSLAGWQTKTALFCEDGRWGTPLGHLPTTAILKPGINPRPGQPFTDSDLVEHVTMAAAAKIGLEVATTRMEQFGSERVLAVTRYDRYHTSSGWRRSHQEDLCQTLGTRPDSKYQTQGGPSPAGIVDLLRGQSIYGEIDVDRFVDALIFNWAVAGIDAHAKNYSLLLARGAAFLAPRYDVMSYLPYREQRPIREIRTAMKVGANYTLGAVDHFGAWEQAGAQLGLAPEAVADRAERILRRCPDAVDAAIDGLDPLDRASPQIAVLSREVRQRRDEVLGAFRVDRSQPTLPQAQQRS